MATEEDAKEKEVDDSAPPAEADAPKEAIVRASDGAGDGELTPGDIAERAEHDAQEAALEDAPIATPTQLGFKKFVYAAYFVGGITIAFLLSKIVDVSWSRLALWKATIGEPKDEIVLPIAALVGAVAAVYYWRRTRARRLAEEVAEELSKVTWPSRTEVTNSTFVVIVATLVSTVFFALMDRFWGFLTNLVYGT